MAYIVHNCGYKPKQEPAFVRPTDGSNKPLEPTVIGSRYIASNTVGSLLTSYAVGVIQKEHVVASNLPQTLYVHPVEFSSLDMPPVVEAELEVKALPILDIRY